MRLRLFLLTLGECVMSDSLELDFLLLSRNLSALYLRELPRELLLLLTLGEELGDREYELYDDRDELRE